MTEARRLRAQRTGTVVTYSRKVFVPLTSLCRDVCGYCTFARPPRRGERAYLLGGQMAIESKVGHGTRVELRLQPPPPGVAP